MEIWIDAQLSPALALWMNQQFEGIEAKSVRALDLRDATDLLIYRSAKEKHAIVMTKDVDFVRLQERFGAPPQIIGITAGNTSDERMRQILKRNFATMTTMLQNGETLVEITG